MIVTRFKVELGDLLSRFFGANGDKNDSSAAALMTAQEIIDAAQEVFRLKLDVILVDSIKGQAKKPAPEIVTTKSDADIISKFNSEKKNEILGRIRSLDTLWAETLDKANIDDSLDIKVDENVNLIKIEISDEVVTHTKLISKSEPKVKTFIRSDTFVCDNSSDRGANGDIFSNINFESLGIKNDTKFLRHELTEISVKLKILRDSADEVVKMIDNLNNNIIENSKSLRPPSAIGLNGLSTTFKTIQRPKIVTTLSAMPSSLSPEELKTTKNSATRKSKSIIPMINTKGSKLSVPETYRSVSLGALNESKSTAKYYDNQTRGSKINGINTKRKSSLRSPSLSSLNLKCRSVIKETKNQMSFCH